MTYSSVIFDMDYFSSHPEEEIRMLSDYIGEHDIHDTFIAFAKNHPEYRFLVTRIGYGIAGFRDEQMAPLFRGCLSSDAPTTTASSTSMPAVSTAASTASSRTDAMPTR